MRLIGYTRVSVAQNDDENGDSLQAQKERLRNIRALYD